MGIHSLCQSFFLLSLLFAVSFCSADNTFQVVGTTLCADCTQKTSQPFSAAAAPRLLCRRRSRSGAHRRSLRQHRRLRRRRLLIQGCHLVRLRAPAVAERKSKKGTLMQIQSDTISAAKAAFNPVRANIMPQRQKKKEEQRVIEAKIRMMRQQEIYNEEERSLKQREMSSSSSMRAHTEVEHCSTRESEEIVASHECSTTSAIRPSPRQRQTR